MFGFDHEGKEGKGDPFLEFATKAAAQHERTMKEKARKDAEWRQMPLWRKVLASSMSVARISGVLAFDFLVPPILLYLLYAATYNLGVYNIPPTPTLWAFLLPYWMWRILATELIAQIKKIHQQ